MKGPQLLAALLLAIPIGLVPAAPALAATPQCPSSGCDGAWVSESNCGKPEAEAYPIASLWVMHHNRPQVMREWMFYSPLCDTFWGQVEHHYGGWDIPLQMWRQPEYGGRNVRAYGAVHVGSSEVEDILETRMVSAKKGAVKFCVGTLDQDPDVEPENQEYDDYQTEDCTTFR